MGDTPKTGTARASFTVGHDTDAEGRTGCTVVAFDRAVATVSDSRGGAPGTRETDALGPDRLVRRADAILLTGGSAMGLSAADGVVRALRERGRGYPTAGGPVPIVPAAVLFDLAVGRAVWPDAAAGRRALGSAVAAPVAETGPVGAGTGATTGGLFGVTRPGGIGIGRISLGADGGDTVTAVVAVNAAGTVGDPPVVGDRRAEWLAATATGSVGGDVSPGENTTIGVVIVDAPADDLTLRRCAIAAHDGLARLIRPAHTLFDGDTFFVAALADGHPAPIDVVRLALATELAVEAAIRSVADGGHRVPDRETGSPIA